MTQKLAYVLYPSTQSVVVFITWRQKKKQVYLANADIAIFLATQIIQLLFFPFLSNIKQCQALLSASSGEEFDHGLILKGSDTKERIKYNGLQRATRYAEIVKEINWFVCLCTWNMIIALFIYYNITSLYVIITCFIYL